MTTAADETTIPGAVADWIQDVCPEIVTGYDYAVAGKDGGLPDVVVEVEFARTTTDDPLFPYSQLQQVMLRVFDLVASIMVDNTVPSEAAALLRSFSARIHEQARLDATLGGRVFLTSPQIESDFVPQFVEYEDGTRGRQVQIRLSVAHLVNT